MTFAYPAGYILLALPVDLNLNYYRGHQLVRSEMFVCFHRDGTSFIHRFWIWFWRNHTKLCVCLCLFVGGWRDAFADYGTQWLWQKLPLPHSEWLVASLQWSPIQTLTQTHVLHPPEVRSTTVPPCGGELHLACRLSIPWGLLLNITKPASLILTIPYYY